MQFATYTQPERTEGDSFKPSEHIGALLIVKVNESKHIESTTHKPEGGPGVVVDVCDLDNGGTVARDVLWMNGAIVDGLKNYVGQLLVIKFAWAKSQKSGREYITVQPADAAEQTRAEAHVKASGDPFAPTLTTPAPANDQPPF